MGKTSAPSSINFEIWGIVFLNVQNEPVNAKPILLPSSNILKTLPHMYVYILYVFTLLEVRVI